MAESTHQLSSLKERSLLAALLSLGARLDPELEKVKDEYMLKLQSIEQTTALLAAAILEDSLLYLHIPGAALFAGAAEGRPLNIRTSTFRDGARVIELAAAVDPDQHIWTNLNGEAASQLAKDILKSIGIELLPSPPDSATRLPDCTGAALYLDPAALTNNLANCASAAERDLGEHVTAKLYSTLFTTSLCDAVNHALNQLDSDLSNSSDGLKNPNSFATNYQQTDQKKLVVAEMNEQDPVTADLMESIKFMVFSLTVFLGAGLVLGHSLA